jgi:hypothetical protein
VKDGDTCLGIASKVWPGDPDGLERLHIFNNLGPLPHVLKPGQKMNLASTSPDATISFLKPDVNVRQAGMPEWLTGKVGQGLFNRDQISTLFGAAAEVLFRDKSVLQLDQNALVTIYGVVKTTHAPVRSGAIEVVQGDMRVKLAALRGEGPKPISVTTPGAQVVAKSEHMLLGVDEKKTSRVSVFEGTAQVAASGKTIDLAKGFGTRINVGEPPEPPQELPSAPKWLSSTATELALSLTKDGAPVTLRWSPVSTADQYRIEVALDDQFRTHISDKKLKRGESLELDFPTLGQGRYFARVSALTANGLSGPPSVTRRVDVVQAVLEAGYPGTKPNTIRAAVEARLRMPTGLGLRASVDDQPVDGDLVRVRGLKRHVIKVMNSSGAVLTSFQCDLEPPKVAIGYAPGLKEVVLQFFDSANKPASFTEAPELGLMGLDGTRVGHAKPLPGGHEWRAPVVPFRAMASTLSAIVRVTWNGQRIAEEMGNETVR